MVDLTKKQKMYYRLYKLDKDGFFIEGRLLKKEKKFTLRELEIALNGSKRNGYTWKFVNELKEKGIIEFSEEKQRNKHWYNFYEINLKKLDAFIIDTEWYVLTRYIVDIAEPK